MLNFVKNFDNLGMEGELLLEGTVTSMAIVAGSISGIAISAVIAL